jgi:diadenosine tetraphosphate (Ap4A) HIT family hydrolase
MNDKLGENLVLLRAQVALAIMVSLLAFGCASPLTGEGSGAGDTITIPAFGKIGSEDVLAHDELFVVLRDKYPVSPGHTLIVARRAVARFHGLTQEERMRLLFWTDWTQRHLTETLTPKPDAFNFGLNDGAAAGQTKPQFHFHIIPRYTGDVPDPRGGVRYVIPSKARYWDTPKAPKEGHP